MKAFFLGTLLLLLCHASNCLSKYLLLFSCLFTFVSCHERAFIYIQSLKLKKKDVFTKSVLSD
jgi:hypothetical protein